ncbi:hypothetical protein GCM10011317_45730 [Niveispirillum cyanobacteriorum]|nr:hypothetical protein GCM10011317_45730 [Niveispirillum cyanobacteriorum]
MLGLLPLSLGTNTDEVERAVTVDAPATLWWMAIPNAIVFGVTFATLVTAAGTPCALMLSTRLQEWRATRMGARLDLR